MRVLPPLVHNIPYTIITFYKITEVQLAYLATSTQAIVPSGNGAFSPRDLLEGRGVTAESALLSSCFSSSMIPIGS